MQRLHLATDDLRHTSSRHMAVPLCEHMQKPTCQSTITALKGALAGSNLYLSIRISDDNAHCEESTTVRMRCSWNVDKQRSTVVSLLKRKTLQMMKLSRQ